MEKNRVKLNICGTDYIVTSEDKEEYVLSIGEEVDLKMRELLDNNERLSMAMASILVALEFCDESKKARISEERSRSEIKQYLEEAARDRIKVEEARHEIDRLRNENKRLRLRLAEDIEPSYAVQKVNQDSQKDVEAHIVGSLKKEQDCDEFVFSSCSAYDDIEDQTDDIMRFFNDSKNGEKIN